jgi:carbamoyltransferase
MAYNILGITPGHNGSVALISDGELMLYLEEERLSKIKYDSNPIRGILYILSQYNIDELVITGVRKEFIPILLDSSTPDIYSNLIQKYQDKLKTTPFWNYHHLAHASNTFYNSGFNKSAVLVVDTAGSTCLFEDQEVEETESIFSFEYPNKVQTYYKSYNNHLDINYSNQKINISSYSNLSKTYEGITQLFGWNSQESGKTMGLSSYGKHNTQIPPLFINGKGNSELFKSVYGQGALTSFKLEVDPKEWHRDFSKVTQFEKDLAFHIQNESENEIFKLVEKTLDLTKLNKIACAGGYFLNCVCNYKLLKKFPNVKFYFDPASHDAGNSMGAALYRWYEYSGDTTIRSRKTLYNGPKYPKEELLEGIKKYVDTPQ